MRDFPNLKSQDKGSGKAQERGSSDAQKKNRFYAFLSRGEQEIFPDIVTGMLKVFYIDICVLPDLGTKLYFVTPFISNKFESYPTF